MIYYMANPLDLLAEMKIPEQRTLSLPSGGIVNLEIIDSGRARVASIVSTDPMDYLQEHLQPGSLLDLSGGLPGVQT